MALAYQPFLTPLGGSPSPLGGGPFGGCRSCARPLGGCLCACCVEPWAPCYPSVHVNEFTVTIWATTDWLGGQPDGSPPIVNSVIMRRGSGTPPLSGFFAPDGVWSYWTGTCYWISDPVTVGSCTIRFQLWEVLLSYIATGSAPPFRVMMLTALGGGSGFDTGNPNNGGSTMMNGACTTPRSGYQIFDTAPAFDPTAVNTYWVSNLGSGAQNEYFLWTCINGDLSGGWGRVVSMVEVVAV